MAELALEPEYVTAGLEPWISRAPAHVVVCVREEDYRARYREPDKTHGEETEEFAWPVPYWWVDAGAAVMLIWLAALDEELACGVYGMPGEGWEGLRGLLGLPADVQPVAVLTIGKEGKDTVQGSAKRGWKPLDDVVVGSAGRPARGGSNRRDLQPVRRIGAAQETARGLPRSRASAASCSLARLPATAARASPASPSRPSAADGHGACGVDGDHRPRRPRRARDRAGCLLWNVAHASRHASTNRRPTARSTAAVPRRGRTRTAHDRRWPHRAVVLGGRLVRHPSHGGARAFRTGVIESLE